MKKTRLIAGLCAAVMVLSGGQVLPAPVFELIGGGITASALSVNATEVTLTHIEQSYKDLLTLPAGKSETFQLSVPGAKSVTYSVSGNTNVSVSSTGLISIVPDYWYWYGNMGYSYKLSGQEPDSITERLSYDDAVVTVNADGQTFTVTVHVVNYAEVFYDEKIQEYIDKNITKSMTDMELMKAICAFPASYPYNYRYSSGRSMVLYGGGDCWASTGLIIDTCEKLGIDAWSRNGNRDPGAGSGHMNAMVYYNGNYYELEAGYGYETAPRPYDVTLRTSLYSTRSATGGISVYQYDGKTNPETLEIPSQIDGKNVVAIGNKFIQQEEGIKKVIIPEGVTSIGDSAFNTCYDLETLVIPSTVTSIGSFALTNCNKLKNIQVASGNQYFTAKDGVLYNKDMTELLFAPAVESITIPSTVKKIADYAFYYNSSVTSITVPASVTDIGVGAFCTCTSLKNVEIQGNGLKTMGNYVFAASKGLTEVYIPASVTTIGDAITHNTSITLKGKSGSYIETYANDNKLPFEAVSDTVKVTGKLFGDAKSTALTGAAVSFKGTKSYPVAVSGSGYSVQLEPGTYTMTVSKAGYAQRKYTVEVKQGQSSVTVDAQLHQYGDLDGSGKIDTADWAMLKGALQGIIKLEDYDQAVADVDGSGAMNVSDATTLKAKITGLIR